MDHNYCQFITIVIENVLKKKNNNYRKLTGQFLKPWPANMGVWMDVDGYGSQPYGTRINSKVACKWDFRPNKSCGFRAGQLEFKYSDAKYKHEYLQNYSNNPFPL